MDINVFRVNNHHFIQDMLVKVILIFHAGKDLTNGTGDCPELFLLLLEQRVFLSRIHTGYVLTDDRSDDAEKITRDLLPITVQALGYQMQNMDCILIADTGAGTPDAVSGWIDARMAVFIGLIASPGLVFASILPGFISGNIARAAAAALDFSGKQVAVGVF